MRKVEELFALAKRAGGAPALNTAEVMLRLEGLDPLGAARRPDNAFVVPLRLLIGVGSFAAALAVLVTGLAASAWTALADPLKLVEVLPDIVTFLHK